MMKVIIARLLQGHRTTKFPQGVPPDIPDRFLGRPAIGSAQCPEGCRACAEVCPTDAIEITNEIRIDLGKCLFCEACARACPERKIAFTGDYRLAVRNRGDLILDSRQTELNLAAKLDAKSRKLFGRSLKLRQVSAGGCNACEADVNVLNTVGWDLSRFGIQFVASPRHADGLLITGPVTRNMELALRKTYEAVPEPKIVIAVGGCAVSGGPYRGHDQVRDGADALVPVDLFIAGCPPHPLTILDGLLRLLGRMENERGFAAQSPGTEGNSRSEADRGESKLPSRFRRFWRGLQPLLERYQRRITEEQVHRGTRRSERESSNLGLDPKVGEESQAETPQKRQSSSKATRNAEEN